MTTDYQKLLRQYNELTDNDPLTSYAVMKSASSLQEYYESKLAKYRKLLNQIKIDVDSVRAKRSSDLSSTVSKGDRDVKFDPEYIRAAKKQATAQYIVDLTQAQVNMLGRIYFDCKMTYEKANRNYREGR